MAGPKRLLALAMAAPLFLAAACTTDSGSDGGDSGDGGSSGGGSGDLSFAVITHGSAGDAFWDVVQNGAEQAGEDLGISVDYQSDGDPQRQAQLIDAAVNQGVDGIVVSMANPDALQDSVEAAVDAGIPVVTINSGGDRSARVRRHRPRRPGRGDRRAGRRAGARGRGRHEGALRHPRGRQHRPRAAVRRRLRGARRRRDRPAGGHQRPARAPSRRSPRSCRATRPSTPSSR